MEIWQILARQTKTKLAEFTFKEKRNILSLLQIKLNQRLPQRIILVETLTLEEKADKFLKGLTEEM